jgi:maltose/moltooligosaccharide transporter
MSEKPRLSFWEIWNMSFGFLGIQFGFGLQLANTSRIFQTMGAEVDELAIYTIAAPLTGLLVQPIIGYLSDRTWHPTLGRRRPYFLIGAILATLSLFLMPNSGTLTMAIGMLWVMDTAFNISMEPFRAFVGDKLPSSQRTFGYAMQSFFIGIGAVVSTSLPFLFTEIGVDNKGTPGVVPDSVKWSFYLGGLVFLLAVLYTVFTTKEYPPTAEEKQAEAKSNSIVSLLEGFVKMPATMWQLAVVQFFSWFALFAMWIYAVPAVCKHVFGLTDPNTEAYQDAANFTGLAIASYNAVSFLVAFLLPVIAKATSRKFTHQVCLALGAAGLLLIYLFPSKATLFVGMGGIGFAWASILSMPYAMLIGALPERQLGFYVGVFNFFIVIPQIVAAVILGWMLNLMYSDKPDPIGAVLIGAISFIVSAAFVSMVDDKDDPARIA